LATPAANASPAAVGARLTPGPIAYPKNIMTSVTTYGAKGDGKADDTAAIQRALADGRSDGATDYFGRPKELYFPAGTYRVSRTLSWEGCCVTLMGQGSRATVIKLVDSAAGFGDARSPKAVVRTTSGNMAFRHFVRDLAIDTGRGNPGAVGLDYISSNTGSVRNVVIRSGDGAGHIGLAMNREWPGPQLIVDVEVDGFDTGIEEANGSLSPVMEHITVRGQRQAGIRTSYYLVARSVKSVNRVPAVIGTGGTLTLVDASLTGGAGGVAISTTGDLFARNVTTAGYATALTRKGKAVKGPKLTEFTSDHTALFTARSASLNLPVKETPRLPLGTAKDWAVGAWREGGNAQLQAVLNSGRPQVLLPAGVTLQYDELVLTVPASVKRIRAFGALVNGDGNGRGGGGIRFVVGNGSSPLIIEGFEAGTTIDHRGNRPVALLDGWYGYSSRAGAGDLYLEDVGVAPLTVQRGQHVWARGYNNEQPGPKPKIVNNGTLWMLGLKTEQKGTVLDARPGSSTELLGGLMYPTQEFTDPADRSTPAVQLTDARASLTFFLQAFGGTRQYPVTVRETRAGTTRALLSSRASGSMLYTSGG